MTFIPKIIYEDEFLIVINKPAGITVNSAKSTGEEDTIEEWAMEYIFRQNKIEIPKTKKRIGQIENLDFFKRKGIVHRLDKQTSGLLILAKNETVFFELQRMFKNHEIEKKYYAVVHGYLPLSGEINEKIERHINKGKYIVGENGKDSFTEYKLIKKYKFSSLALNPFGSMNFKRLKEKYDLLSYSLCEIALHTGRTHQIRVHFAYIHHPLLGDDLYGFRKLIKFENIWVKRQCLHAFFLRFNHPITKKQLQFEIDISEDIQEVINKYLIPVE